MNSEINCKFEVNQLVWAKLIGYPPWPAVIYHVSPYVVIFLGEKKYSNPMYESKLKAYSDSKPNKKHINNKAYKLAVYTAEKILSGEVRFEDAEELYELVDDPSFVNKTKINEKFKYMVSSQIFIGKKTNFIGRKRKRNTKNKKENVYEKELKKIKKIKKTKRSTDLNEEVESDFVICSKTPELTSQKENLNVFDYVNSEECEKSFVNIEKELNLDVNLNIKPNEEIIDIYMQIEKNEKNVSEIKIQQFDQIIEIYKEKDDDQDYGPEPISESDHISDDEPVSYPGRV